ncbi:MAG: HlyC/CorC family transporter [Oscillospiraceae bacterium]|nr:HlyC/CorC family transporter [Oscillospiraceae bacterium]
MDDGSRLSWIIIFVLYLFMAYFAIAETAFASVSKIKIRTALERDDSRAEKAMRVLDDFDRAVTTVLIGTNITHLAVASIVTVLVTREFGLSFVALGTIITTLAVFFFGEMLPKSIAKRYSEPLALTCASSLLMFMRLFTPISFLLTKIGQFAAGLSGGEEEVSVTEDELYDIIEDMADEGSLDEEQSELISSALEFGDITVESILTSRVDMDALEVSTPPEKIVEFLLSHRHSRYPVYEGTTDHIVGTLQMRKYLKAYRKDKHPDLRSMIDTPFFVHYSMSVDDLLREMNAKKVSIAIVLDDFGGTYGITTAEDALEELVGEIWDEEDIIVEDFKQVEEHKYLASADLTVGDIFQYMDMEIDDEDEDLEYKRASEWAFEHFTHIPTVGETFTYEDITVMVSRMKLNRIEQLLITVQDSRGGEDA